MEPVNVRWYVDLPIPHNEVFFVPGIEEHGQVIFLAGDCQSTTTEGHYTLAEGYLRVFDLLGVRRILHTGLVRGWSYG